jgi:hypothetical protein
MHPSLPRIYWSNSFAIPADLSQGVGINCVQWTAAHLNASSNGRMHFSLAEYSSPGGSGLNEVNSGDFYIVDGLTAVSTFFGPPPGTATLSTTMSIIATVTANFTVSSILLAASPSLSASKVELDAHFFAHPFARPFAHLFAYLSVRAEHEAWPRPRSRTRDSTGSIGCNPGMARVSRAERETS